MKLIALLVGLLIISILAFKQLSPQHEPATVEGSDQQVTLPKVPTSPEGIKEFEKDMNKFMKDQQQETENKLREVEEQ